MRKILSITVKELLLLLRDRAGLAVLFIMPAILVVVLTLVQENVMELTGQKSTQILYLDLDGGALSGALQKNLETGSLQLVVWENERKTLADLQTAVAVGDYQAGVVVPAGSTVRLQEETEQMLQNSKASDPRNPIALIPVKVFFDPGIMPGLRSGIMAQLQMALHALAMEAKIETLERMLKGAGEGLGVLPPALAGLKGSGFTELMGQPLMTLEVNRDSTGVTGTIDYNPVQQNVPAWALFGIFFTAIPIAGGILRERKSGLWIRLTALPVSPFLLFTGKVAAYIGVCLCQFLLIYCIGAVLFPVMGLPAFTVSHNPAAVLLTVLLSSLAACGYGIFLGMACNTYEQASTIGATTIVAAAAIGGVMVPVYAMPHIMQRLSILSPFNWSLTAFHELLVRGNSLSAIGYDLGLLALFFLVAVLFSWKMARIRI